MNEAVCTLRSLVGAASVNSAQGQATLREELRALLQDETDLDGLRAAVGLSGDLLEADDLLSSSLATRCLGCLPGRQRAVLIEAIVNRILAGVVRHPDEHKGDEEADTDAVLAWLDDMCPADEWPPNAPAAPPRAATEALDSSGVWGMAARGVQVCACADDVSRGRGCFAVRDFAAGDFVGLYWGEALTTREYSVRHGWNNAQLPVDLRAHEVSGERERRQRLAVLTTEQGAPMGGVDNGGAYVVSLLQHHCHTEYIQYNPPPRAIHRWPLYVDAEDGLQSSWPRYINHAQEGTLACNLTARSDAQRALMWFEAHREIRAGEELCFDYGDGFDAWLRREAQLQ